MERTIKIPALYLLFAVFLHINENEHVASCCVVEYTESIVEAGRNEFCSHSLHFPYIPVLSNVIT